MSDQLRAASGPSPRLVKILVYGSALFPFFLIALIDSSVGFIGWWMTLLISIFLPLVKNKEIGYNGWSRKRHAIWVGFVLLLGLILAAPEKSDDLYCELTPLTMSTWMLNKTDEAPVKAGDLFLGKTFTEEVNQNPEGLDAYVKSLIENTDCIVGDLTFGDALVLIAKSDSVRGVLAEQTISDLYGIKNYLEGGAEAARLNLEGVISEQGESIAIDFGDARLKTDASMNQIINEVTSGTGDFYDLSSLKGKRVSLPIGVSLVESEVVVVPKVDIPKSEILIDGKNLGSWQAGDSAYLVAKQKQAELELEEERLAEAERKAEEAAAERAIPKLSAVALHNAFMNNEMRANENYNEKVVQITGVVDEIEESWLSGAIVRLRIGYFDYLSCYLNSTDENKTRALRLNVGSKVVIRGECDGLSLGSVSLSDCDIK